MNKFFLAVGALLLSTFGATAQPAPGSFPGCVYNSTPPSLSDKQPTALQCDSSGRVKTTGGGGAAGITIGTTTITGGTTTRVLYDNAGVVGEYTISGTGNVAMTTSPTFTTPILGTPTSGVATNLTGLPLTTGVTGVLPVANGGTGLTSGTSGGILGYTASGVLASSAALGATQVVVGGGAGATPTSSATLVSNSAGQTTIQGLTTTSPGYYAQVTGDAVPRVRIGLNASDMGGIAAGDGTNPRDTFQSRVAAGNWHYGAPDVDTAPVAQIDSVQNALAGGTSNVAGANRIIAGSQGKGTGGGGSIIFQVAPAGSTGAAVNALATAVTIASTGTLTFANTSGGSATISPLATSTGIGTGLSIGVDLLISSTNGVQTKPTGSYSWGTFGSTPDLVLLRGAPNTLDQRNGANAQTSRLYGSFTDASNGDWLESSKAAGGAAYIRTVKNGTGTASTLSLGAGGANQILIDGTGISVTGIGTFTSSIQTNASMQVGGASAMYWTSGSMLRSPSDGVIKISNNGETDFTRLQFGGTTSSFPAEARNGINIDFKLADDSTFTSIGARTLISKGAVPTLTLSGGTCAGSVISGGSTAGTVTVTGVCVATNTLALTVMPTAPTGYACDAVDRTLGTTLLGQTATTTTSATFTFSGTTGATDVIQYKCIAY